jgi:hypothetical protein
MPDNLHLVDCNFGTEFDICEVYQNLRLGFVHITIIAALIKEYIILQMVKNSGVNLVKL